MVLAGSNHWESNNLKEEETLAKKMGKEENTKVEDVEEGEISDTASVEEISEEDFKKQEDKVVKDAKSKDARVWTVRDLYKYGGGYVSGLYNLAWAQAVQNKRFNELFVDVDPDENSKRSSPSSSSIASVNSGTKEEKNLEKVVIDDSGDEMDVKTVDVEREEGELEEGEIDLDSEPVDKVDGEDEEVVLSGDRMIVDSSEVESIVKEFLEKKVNSIRDDLESTVNEAEKSFEAVCSKLQVTLQNLSEVILENNVSTKDALIQLSFSAVQAVNSVFCSMNHNLKEHNKDMFSRFLSLLNRYDPPLFSHEQFKEIEVMLSYVDTPGSWFHARSDEKEKGIQVSDGADKDHNDDALTKSAVHDLISINKLPTATESFVHNKPIVSSETPKPGNSSFKGRGVVLPLLDLHKDHDADSLPSPTRETSPSFPVSRLLNVGDGMIKSALPAPPKVALDTEDARRHLYETDALKAVSSYQQKFGRSSFFVSNDLPSPTPSEESGEGEGDTGGDVSSSSPVGNFKTVNQPILGQTISSPSPLPLTPPLTAPLTKSSSMHIVVPAVNAASMSSVSSSTVKTSAKSRDPRLRFINTDTTALEHNKTVVPTASNPPKVEAVGKIMGLRKQKTVEDAILDGPLLKKQRISLENTGVVGDVKTVNGSGGWLEDTDMVGPQTRHRNQSAENAESDPRRIDNGVTCPSTAGKSNATVSGNGQLPVSGTRNIIGSEQVPVTPTIATSLPDLLKDIAVNPTMLLNILKMGQQQRLVQDNQQKSSNPAKNTADPPSSNSILGSVPVNVAHPQSSGILPRPAGIPQAPSQVSVMDELTKIRMKPRDPRRVLHNNALQRPGSLGLEHFKTNAAPTTANQATLDNQNVQKQELQAKMKPVPSQSFVPPDISVPFTKSLKNVADIVSVSQTSTSLISQNVAAQAAQIKLNMVDGKPANSNSDQQNVTSSAAVVGAAISRSQGTWEDVEHLFEGYDDQQKAAIQRERARRIEEQKKMFAAHKLCLVLDLDHTLLNSAKFVEIDPVHEEILKKKEEQDREKQHRHLFRFHHMGMWTKLRPGIWNFLEKASKMFELHLYTMGNKLYATEMAKVLDPKGLLFNGRVISRGDDGDPFDSDERVPKSKDLEGVLGMESAVVIIDDSVRVWPHNKLNLIVVERYIYFPCSRRQFGLPGPSLLEIDHDERPEDGTLASSLSVIERIHQNFFTHQSFDEADVRNILASEQRKILAGCRIVFSRVFPVGEVNPHLHPLWQTAEQFGAVCTNQIDEQVTHVVANSLGTDKVNWALSTGRYVVHPGWVEASALLYRRANEHDFAIKP